ncbi:MAG: MEDS domain-containing protein [Desulfobacterales bacterium]
MALPDPQRDLERELWKLQAGDHLCALYESAAERDLVRTTFIRQGLERHEAVLVLTEEGGEETVERGLQEQGVDPAPRRKRRQLEIRRALDFPPAGPPSDAEALLGALRRIAGLRIAEGYAALRISADIGPGLLAAIQPPKLLRWGSGLNPHLSVLPALLVCHYDQRRTPAAFLLEAFAIHPRVLIGTELYDNFYFLPPAEADGSDPAAARLARWIRHLQERKRSETQIRSLTRKLMKTQEDERRMISRELHDRLGQDLSGIKIALQTLPDRHPSAPPALQEDLHRLSRILERAILTVRDLAYELRPPGLEEMGLVQAMAMFCREFAEKTGLAVEFRAVGVDRLQLDFQVQIQLYRMVQEALNNVHKHARASRAVVKLAAVRPHLLLRVEDDGQGFDVAERARAIDAEKRMGLRSLQERAEVLGGVLLVTSAPGRGTKILAKLPCPE